MHRNLSAPRLLLLSCLLVLVAATSARGDDEIDPVRPGDEIEVQWFSKWYPGTVESFENGRASVRYKRGSFDSNGEFDLSKMRFPNNEGHWMVWKDSSGKFSVEARYISRTETEVTIRKEDGTEATVPIANLHPSLRRQVNKTPLTSDLTSPVHVGDEVEVKYFSKWYDGVVTAVVGETATVDYEEGDGGTGTRQFELKDMRFPNGEGHWMIWKDATGNFKVEARYLARTETEVTLLKTDGSKLNVPIDRLHPSLRKQVCQDNRDQ